MKIIPKPKKAMLADGQFIMNMQTAINVPALLSKYGKELKESVEGILGFSFPIKLQKNNVIRLELDEKVNHCQGYEIHIKEDVVEIKGSTEAGLFYGIQSFIQLIKEYKRYIPCCIIEDEPEFLERGFYYDGTRGRVPTLKTLKELADKCAYYKMNQLQVYVEHTFAYTGQSEVWSCTDPLTAEEILEFDAYCREKHIELVPSIATFGHLYEALRSECYKDLCELENPEVDEYSWIGRMQHHTLDVSNSESIIFVKKMIEDIVPLFTSDKFNICGDETFDLGKGKNKELSDKHGTSKLYVDFLNKIVDIVKSHNKEVMFWGDIIIQHPEYVEHLPKDLVCLNWWYWGEYEEEKVKVIADNGFIQYLCPGTLGWNNLMNNHRESFINTKAMARWGKKYGARGILNTDWGDYGHFNAPESSILGLIYGANFSWNTEEIPENEINNAIDCVEFSCVDDSITDILVGIYECQKIDFGGVVSWMERGNDFTKEKWTVVPFAELVSIEEKLEGYRTRLLDLLSSSDADTQHQIRTYLTMTQGISYFNQLFSVIQHKALLFDEPAEVDCKQLAEEIEIWLMDYKANWRLANKESELYRIVAFMRKVTLWLRQI